MHLGIPIFAATFFFTMSSPTATTCTSVAGVWSRLFEEDPIGDDATADKTTLVLWTQTPKSGIYVDLRLPRNSPGRSDTVCERTPCPSALRATCDDTLSAYDTTVLSKQKSFAGILTFHQGDTSDPSGVALAKDDVLAKIAKDETAALPLCTCFWRRDIDYQPPSGGLDIGVCASYSPQAKDGSVDVRETGDDGSYAEGWRRLPDTFQGPFMALELMSENGQPRSGYWVRTGNRFAYAVGRPTSTENAQALGCSPNSATVKDQVGKTLQQVIQASSDAKDQLSLMASYVSAAGEIPSEQGEAWQILYSTNPGLVGCLLVGSDLEKEKNICSVLKADKNDVQEGDIVEQVVCGDGSFVRKWKVVELSGCSLPF